MTLALYEILRGGGIGRGGFNFDAHLRRQSVDPADLFHAHVGGMDTLARALLCAASLIEEGALGRFVEDRYRAWSGPLGRHLLGDDANLEQLWSRALEHDRDPRPTSGRQEMLENLLRRHL
jgi:xylose isomerase